MKITSGSVSCGGVIGTRIIIFATRFAITVTNLTGLDHVILTNRGAIIVVEAIAPRSAAPIVIGAICHVDIAADNIAGSGRPI